MRAHARRGVEYFRVSPKFHPAEEEQNLGLTRESATPTRAEETELQQA